MDHLTLDDIIEFVSLTELNEESKQWISTVNTHIATCEECRALVRSFQAVYDELSHTDLTAGWQSERQMAAFSGAELADDGE